MGPPQIGLLRSSALLPSSSAPGDAPIHSHQTAREHCLQTRLHPAMRRQKAYCVLFGCTHGSCNGGRGRREGSGISLRHLNGDWSWGVLSPPVCSSLPLLSRQPQPPTRVQPGTAVCAARRSGALFPPRREYGGTTFSKLVEGSTYVLWAPLLCRSCPLSPFAGSLFVRPI